MSEKTDVDQEHEDNNALPGELPEHQYSKVCKTVLGIPVLFLLQFSDVMIFPPPIVN